MALNVPLEPGWGLAEAVGLQFLGSALASWPLAAGAGIWALRPARGTAQAALAASLRDPAEVGLFSKSCSGSRMLPPPTHPRGICWLPTSPCSALAPLSTSRPSPSAHLANRYGRR